MSFTPHMLKSLANRVFLTHGINRDGEELYVYLLVDKGKEKRFASLKKNSQYELDEYGKILMAGRGTTPPEFVQTYIKNLFLKHA